MLFFFVMVLWEPVTARMLEGFEAAEVQTGEASIFVRRSGSGPPILLLHGFPQTHLMWRSVAPILAIGSSLVDLLTSPSVVKLK